MRILLTGGSGFIGRNIKESYLSRKYTIIAPSHQELELLDEHAVRSFIINNGVDCIIHSAVRPGHRNAKDPSNQLDNNTRMFFNLARNSSHYKKMIYIGSGLVYDLRHYQPKMREEYFDNHVPIDEGGFSKYIISKYIEKDDNIVELRIFGIFGKYEDYAIRFISNLICKAIFGLPLTMNQNRRFDYIYIDDLMPILEFFIENDPPHSAYNITPDNSIELLELAKKINSLSEKELPINVSTDGIGTEYSGDNSRIKLLIKNLQWQPIDESIEKLFQWYKKNIIGVDKNLLLYDK